MRVLIEQSEWLFAIGKGATLVAGWAALAWYAQHNLTFVRKASLWGTAAYVAIWCGWFFGAELMDNQPGMPPEPRSLTAPAESEVAPITIYV